MVFNYTLAEKIALAQIDSMSREELEEYAFGHVLDYLHDLSDDELADLADQWEVTNAE